MDFLDAASADLLQRSLAEDDHWVQVINSGDKVFELSRQARAGFSNAQTVGLEKALYRAAGEGFQFRYEVLRVSDDEREREMTGRRLDRFAQFMCSADTLRFLRHVTGDESLTFADAQATRYGPGDFLTGHDDNVASKRRAAAYVYNLAPRWRPEWGGLLLFHDAGDEASLALTPTFNCLNLFAVPQQHSVSMVTPFAGGPRLSITGWLRALN